MDARMETAVRNSLKRILPNLNEDQIESVLRRYDRLVNGGHAEDYSFVMSIQKYRNAKT